MNATTIPRNDPIFVGTRCHVPAMSIMILPAASRLLIFQDKRKKFLISLIKHKYNLNFKRSSRTSQTKANRIDAGGPGFEFGRCITSLTLIFQ